MKEYDNVTMTVVPFGDSTSGSFKYSDGNLSFYLREYFHGADNPRWREQVEKNEQAATPVVARRETASYSYKQTRVVQHYMSTPATTDRHSVGNLGPNIATWSSDIVEKAEADAWNGLMKSIRQTQSSYDGMVFLGEIGQTTAMLRHPLKAIDEGLRKLLRRKRVVRTIRTSRGLKKVSSKVALPQSFSRNPLLNGKTAAELTLQWNFGIVPLLNDLQGMMKALEAVPLSGKTRVRGYGKAQNEGKADYGTDASGIILVRKSGTFTSSVEVIYTAGISESITRPGAYQRLLDRGAFSLLDLPSAVYNLLPWSFLVDYVSNVGDVLAGIFTSRRDVKWITRSEIRTWTGTMYCSPEPSTNYKISTYGYASVTVNVRTFTRTVVPVDVVKLPPVYLELPKHVRQYVNIAALARLLKH